MRNRWMLGAVVLVASALALVLVDRRRSEPTYLTSVDRNTGAVRWRVELPRAGAQWISEEGDHLAVFVCDHRPHGAVLVNPTSGVIIGESPFRAFPSNSSTPVTDGQDAPAAVYWKDPGPGGHGMRVADEFVYDNDTGSLVSDEGWSVEVAVGGPYFWIPVLTQDDAVFFVEHVGGCSGFD